MPYQLSKSDFKIASSCPKKLQYKKLGYPSTMEENEFMKMLAEGGYIIGKLATLVYPGTEITGNTQEALAQTTELLKQKNITLHEAAISVGQKLIRIDILQKTGNHFNLIEVKAKSFNSEDRKAAEDNNMQEYIEDVVFQSLVLKEAYPQATVDAFLLMPDKAKETNIEGLNAWFTVRTGETEAYRPGTFRKITVDFVFDGTAEFESKRQELKADQLLCLMPLHDKVQRMGPGIQSRAAQFLNILNKDFVTVNNYYSINKQCKGCEYKAEASAEKNGYLECWGELGKTDPHIFDLHHGGSIRHYSKGFYFDELIAAGKTNLFDIDPERLKKANGVYGSRGERQLLQIQKTRSQEEWINPAMQGELNSWTYPLHFIDFETYTGAIPFHQGMRPYEIVAFQWSCHTISHPGAVPVHSEWINTENSFPNFRFAEALMKQIGYSGTPLMWATHENTVLRKILEQMDTRNYHNIVLKKWLTEITKDKDREGRLVDMNAFTLNHYFHPYMKGQTSIKKTLPAIWNHHPELHTVDWFKQYSRKGEGGDIMDPYKTLKYLFAPESLESAMATLEIDEVVHEGCAAMKAYADMMSGDPAQKESLQQQLLAYCKLDTMAMVIIWYYWRNHSALSHQNSVS